MSRRVAIASVSAATTSVWRQSGKQVRGSRAHAGRRGPAWSSGHALATNPTYAFSLKWLLIVCSSRYEVAGMRPARACDGVSERDASRRPAAAVRRRWRGFHTALASFPVLASPHPPPHSQATHHPPVIANNVAGDLRVKAN